MSRLRAVAFAVIYAGAIAYLSLYPWTFESTPRTSGLYWIPLTDNRLLLDAALNVLFYVPFGAAVLVAFENTALGLFGATSAGFLLSFAIEWTQRYIPVRLGNLDDLLTNTVGAFTGALTALVWTRVAQVPRGRHKGVHFPGSAILSFMWVLWNGFLLLPAINHVPLPLNRLWIDSITAFLGFLVLSLALKAHPLLTAALGLAFFPAMWVQPVALFARLLAITAAFLLVRSGNPRLPRFAGVACLLWLGYQELYPFQWAAPPLAFSWIPFHSLFTTRPQTYYPTMFEKLFFFTAVVWALRHNGLRSVWAVVAPVVVLAIGETVQRFMPARNPELTDLILMVAGAFFLWLADPEAWSSAGGQAAARLRDQVSGAQE